MIKRGMHLTCRTRKRGKNFLKLKILSWLSAVIPATWEEEIRRIMVLSSLGKKVMRPPSQKISKA
jgi:hypothetical protein